jgi:hypothetical protein
LHKREDGDPNVPERTQSCLYRKTRQRIEEQVNEEMQQAVEILEVNPFPLLVLGLLELV